MNVGRVEFRRVRETGRGKREVEVEEGLEGIGVRGSACLGRRIASSCSLRSALSSRTPTRRSSRSSSSLPILCAALAASLPTLCALALALLFLAALSSSLASVSSLTRASLSALRRLSSRPPRRLVRLGLVLRCLALVHL